MTSPSRQEDIEGEVSLQDQSFLEQPSDLGNPAEAAFTDIDRAKEEELHQDPSTLPEQAGEFDFADPVESAEPGFTGDDTVEGAEVPEAETEGLTAEASDPTASVPEPAVADTAGIATEANTTCPGDIVPPPTSPNLVEPGTDPIQVGHSPATSSNPQDKGLGQVGVVPQPGGRKLKSLVERLRGISKLAIP